MGGRHQLGGVIAFLFADLIAMPLLLIYRKYYGTRLTVRLVAVFYTVMVLAGLTTGAVFTVAGVVPTTRSVEITAAHFEWNYTTFLNVVFLAVAAAVYALHRARRPARRGERARLRPGLRDAGPRRRRCRRSPGVDGATSYFCSDRCRDRFLAAHGGPGLPAHADRVAVDPVCGMQVPLTPDAVTLDAEGATHYFCCAGCRERFAAGASAAGPS